MRGLSWPGPLQGYPDRSGTVGSPADPAPAKMFVAFSRGHHVSLIDCPVGFTAANSKGQESGYFQTRLPWPELQRLDAKHPGCAGRLMPLNASVATMEKGAVEVALIWDFNALTWRDIVG